MAETAGFGPANRSCHSDHTAYKAGAFGHSATSPWFNGGRDQVRTGAYILAGNVPFQLGYRPKCKRPLLLVGAFENSNLNLECYEQTNPEGRTRLTRRLIMDLVRIIIAKVSIAWVSTLPSRIEASYTPVEKIYLHAQRSYGILLDAEEMPNVVSIPIRSERVLNATPRR